MLKRIMYQLRFDSPFIIGSGVAVPGHFDHMSLLSDNLPYIPASSIRGRIRASVLYHCARNESDWARYCVCSGQTGRGEVFCVPDDNPGTLGDYGTCSLCRLFGSPGGEVRRGYDFSAARVPEVMGDFLKELQKTAPEGGLLLRRTRNRRDYRLRRAQEDTFFVLGVVDPVMALEGMVVEQPHHLRYDNATQEFDHGLLLLGLRMTTELGGGRNRGYGRCRFFPQGDPSLWDQPMRTHVEDWKTAKQQSRQKG